MSEAMSILQEAIALSFVSKNNYRNRKNRIKSTLKKGHITGRLQEWENDWVCCSARPPNVHGFNMASDSFPSMRVKRMCNKTTQHQLLTCTAETGTTVFQSSYNLEETSIASFKDIDNIQSGITFVTAGEDELKESVKKPTNMPLEVFEDWRSFRALLLKNKSIERKDVKNVVSPGNTGLSGCGLIGSTNWAHTIEKPELGCLLVATERLHSHPFFSKAVVLVISCGACGDFRGILLNKAMPSSMMQKALVSRWKHGLPVGLLGSSTFFGGPHSADKLQVLSCNKSLRGLQPLIPGLYLGGEDVMQSTSSSVIRGYITREEIQLYMGELKWTSRYLATEINIFQWWHVVACSRSLVFHCPRSDLWTTAMDAISHK
ncbi:hypothetical protein O6H91_07G075200 [Diphasiastrum complanatum]|uniref:Uncharacterized protein n=2 Tax=Diphasiastrum complanatum TaxID=34168 RepID=A0ACC2D6R2_DIPCM|nr:hypothetical protein O6H91_07G075200 [Diphasiastrum complanatum]KAJ7549928.1 hypothetical protein O6H91_07G075200 [Diphasiastrum complanatum]